MPDKDFAKVSLLDLEQTKAEFSQVAEQLEKFKVQVTFFFIPDLNSGVVTSENMT